MAALGVLEEQVVDRAQQTRNIFQRQRILAAQIGLQVRHQQRGGHSLARNVGQHQTKTSRTEIEKVVVIAANGARLDAFAGTVQRRQRGRLLRQQTALHLARELHFLRGAPLRFHALGHLLGQRDAAHGDACLTCDRSQQALVAGGIRFLGKPRAQHQTSLQLPFSGAANGHQTFRLQQRQLRSLHLFGSQLQRLRCSRPAWQSLPPWATESSPRPAARLHRRGTVSPRCQDTQTWFADAAHSRCSAAAAQPVLRAW